MPLPHRWTRSAATVWGVPYGVAIAAQRILQRAAF
jgi:hypothetical protein